MRTFWILRLYLCLPDGLNNSMFNRRLISACARCLGAMSVIGLLAHAAKAADSYTEHPGGEGEGN